MVNPPLRLHAPSDSEDEGCYVFWETKSILAPVPGSSDGPSRSSRSDAPSPSFGCTSNGTPKTKRTTSLASLPSPSGSTTSTTRPLRQRKKRRALNRGNGAEASSQPLDAHTLRMVSQLAMKVNARAAGLVSPMVTRGAAAAATTPSTVGKGKGKELDVQTAEKPPRYPLKPSPSGSNTPLRRPPARSPQTLLTLCTTSTKSSLSKTSLSSSVTKPSLPPPPLPPLHRRTSATTLDEDDEDSYFEEGDSFEFALSQLDESLITASPPLESAPKAEVPVKPGPKPAPAPRVAAARLPGTAPVRSSPRLARQAATTARQPPPPAPAALPRTSTRPTSAAPPPRPAAPPSRPAPPPRAPSIRLSAAPSSSQSASNVKTRGTLSAAKQREMEELARREVEALEALGGAGEWSDEDF